MFNRSKYKPYFLKSRNKEELYKLYFVDLQRIGREHGIELDKKGKSKMEIVDTLYKYL